MGKLTDWHTHCFLPEHRSADDPERWKRTHVAGTGRADPDLFTAGIEAAGIEQFVLITLPRFENMRQPHDFVADMVAQYPGRGVGVASVHPYEAGAGDEFERAVTKHNMKGLKISPTYQAIDPRSKECFELYEIALSHDIPVMFHCGGGYTGSLEFSDPCLLDKVALTYPALKIIVCHFGQPYMEQTAIVMRKNENVYADMSARTHRPWQLYNGIMIAHEYKVSDRLLFGTDFPVREHKVAIEEFVNINNWGQGINMPPIPDELIHDMMYERPLSMLGMAPD